MKQLRKAVLSNAQLVAFMIKWKINAIIVIKDVILVFQKRIINVLVVDPHISFFRDIAYVIALKDLLLTVLKINVKYLEIVHQIVLFVFQKKLVYSAEKGI